MEEVSDGCVAELDTAVESVDLEGTAEEEKPGTSVVEVTLLDGMLGTSDGLIGMSVLLVSVKLGTLVEDKV